MSCSLELLHLLFLMVSVGLCLERKSCIWRWCYLRFLVFLDVSLLLKALRVIAHFNHVSNRDRMPHRFSLTVNKSNSGQKELQLNYSTLDPWQNTRHRHIVDDIGLYSPKYLRDFTKSTLIDEPSVSEIEIYPSPVRSILNDGQISRINVGYFMADLITDEDVWNQWKGQMPVIYNKGTTS